MDTRGRAARQQVTPAAFDTRLLAPLVLGAILNPINSTMLAVALVPIGVAFGRSTGETAWLITGLYLATAVGQPVVGRLVDLWGPRRLQMLGAMLVGVGGVIGALAPSFWWLVAARVVLGLGTCAGYPAAMAMVRREAARTSRPSPANVLAVLAASSQVVMVFGPTLAGVLLGLGDWRWIFWINVPLALACLVLTRMILPPGRDPALAPLEGRAVERLDLGGMVLFATALVAAMVLLMRPEPARWPFGLAAVVLGVLFVARERSRAHPFIDVRALVANRGLVLTYVRQGLTMLVFYCFTYALAQWLEEGRGLAAHEAGLVLLAPGLTAVLATATLGRRSRVRTNLLVGTGCQLLAAAALLVLSASTPIVALVALGLTIGVPQGLNSLGNQNALYAQAPAERTASAAGLLRTATYVAALAAAALQASAFAEGATDAGLATLGTVLVVSTAAHGLLVAFDPALRRVGARS